MAQQSRKHFGGPAILSYGFRPFFLLALAFAVFAMIVWLVVYFGYWTLPSAMAPVDWHIHEMLFGYTAAVVCGFLFTAIPNWTGRMPIRGWPLAGMVGIWVAGRLAMLGVGGLGAVPMMVVDCAFLGAVLLSAVREVVAGRNWRNLMVVVPVGLFLVANILFHLEVMTEGVAGVGRRLGIAVVVFLITLIGGRIIPSFTRNWLVKQGSNKLPTPMNRFDGLCLIWGVMALGFWVAAPVSFGARGVLGAAAVLHALRLARWSGVQTRPSRLLFMLHLAYSFVPVGLLALALDLQTQGVHILGIGAIGGMTVAVIIRATLGHTGRELVAGPLLIAGFALVPLAMLVRVLAQQMDGFGAVGIQISGGLWVAGFAAIFWRIGPWLWSDSVKKRSPN